MHITPPTIPVVTFKNKTDNAPKQFQGDWTKLTKRLTRHTSRPEKDGPAWSPTKYAPGSSRGNEGVVTVSCFVADIDDGTPAAALRGRWKTPDGQPLAFALHSSYSSTLEQPKYRVIFPLAVPVPASEWPAVHRKLTVALLGDHADPACKDAARLYYLPSCPAEAEEAAFADIGEGEPLDPASFPDPEPEEVADAQTRQAIRTSPPRPVSSDGGGKPGEDYSERGDVLELLTRYGWQTVSERGGVTYLRRPGKTHDISGTFGYGGSRAFHPFTSSAPPFEANESYSGFAVYTLLEHGGDYPASAKALAALGYGEQMPAAPSAKKTEPASAKTITAIEPIPAPASAAWPEASEAMFYGLAGDFVRTVEPHTEADPVAVLVQFLLAFGSACKRSAHFAAEADKHYSNMNAVLVGVSSKGRKGTSWGRVRCLFEDAEPAWATACLQSGLSSGEGLIHAVRDPVEKQVMNKKTGETETVVEDAGVEDKRLLVQESEFASVLRVAGRDGNTLSAILRDAWDGRTLQTMTKNNAAKATGSHISLIGHITADELKRELTSTEAGNGFANRFLWIVVRRSKELPEGGSLQPHELNPLTQRLKQAITAAKSRQEMKRDDGARAVWLSVYSALSAGGPGLLGVVTSRGEAQVMRLALLYALLDGDEAIRRPHMEAALALWDYCEESARYVFGDALGDAIADSILRGLRDAKNGLTRTEIGERFNRHESSGRIDAALALLHTGGRIRGQKETTSGRPIERWFIVL